MENEEWKMENARGRGRASVFHSVCLGVTAQSTPINGKLQG